MELGLELKIPGLIDSGVNMTSALLVLLLDHKPCVDPVGEAVAAILGGNDHQVNGTTEEGDLYVETPGLLGETLPGALSDKFAVDEDLELELGEQCACCAYFVPE